MIIVERLVQLQLYYMITYEVVSIPIKKVLVLFVVEITGLL